jgi:ABC-type nickel/cobalt efflux system permease component RcnA
MFKGENAIGVILLAACAVVAVVLLYSIGTGERFRFTGPGWLGTALVIVFVGVGIWQFVSFLRQRRPWQRGELTDHDLRDRTRDP